MKRLFFLIVSLLLFTTCKTDKNQSSNLFNYIPENASTILRVNNLESLYLGIESNDLLNEVGKYAVAKQLKQTLKLIEHINTSDELLICLSKETNDSTSFSLITKYSKSLFVLDSIPNHSVETVASKTKTIKKITIDNQILYTTVTDSIFFASNMLSNVESSLLKTVKNENLEQLYNTANPKSTVSILMDYKSKKNNPRFFINDTLNDIQWTNHVLIESDISQDAILFNGISKATDSTKSFINVFKNSIPQENQIAKISPTDVDALISFTFNNFQDFNEHLIAFNQSDSTTTSSIFDNITEVGVITRDDYDAVFLNSIDSNSTQEAIDSQALIETFRDVDIWAFENTTLFKDTFSPLVQTNSAENFIVLNDFFIFSDHIDFLKALISDYQNNTVLEESSHYQNIMLNLSDEASLFVYGNAFHLNELLNANFSEEKSLKLKSYKASALQFVYDTDFAHVNGIIKKHKARAVSNSVTEDLNIVIDNDILMSPQLVKNHLSNQKDIAVQDIDNTLYLISNQGKIFWKKRLEGKILGDIEQIDMYKNGRLQLAFATANRVYVLDRNGKDVSPFPLKFNDEITQPLSVFDYDKKKKYRLLVTQNKALLMYDAKGKLVKGFTYKKAKNTITTQPKHFRIGRKDFITFAQGSKLEILDRIGKTRVDVKAPINFSENEIYLYKNKFSTTDTGGNFIQVNEKGQFSSSQLNLSDNHKIATTSKTLVSLSDNQLTIKSRTIELDFGQYTAPRIYYVNDKIYVSTTDLQAKKIYLFDSQAKPIANFPVYGNSTIELHNIDRDNNLELVTKGDHNSIIIYQLN